LHQHRIKANDGIKN